MKKEKVLIFVLTHRDEWKYGYPKGYHTLWLGMKSHTIDRSYPWRDDNLPSGSLCDQNYLYSEYSGFYFLWKSLQAEDSNAIIVIDHYDWFFSKKRVFRFMLTQTDVRRLMKKNEVYFPTPTDIASNFNGMDVYALNRTALAANIDLLEPAIAKLYPEALTALREVYASHSLCSGNMMICRKSFFDGYAGFYFAIIDEIKDRIDLTGIKDRRIFGFMGEILINVFANYKKAQLACLPASSCLPIRQQISSKWREVRKKD